MVFVFDAINLFSRGIVIVLFLNEILSFFLKSNIKLISYSLQLFDLDASEFIIMLFFSNIREKVVSDEF